jgi:hypothetical protein
LAFYREGERNIAVGINSSGALVAKYDSGTEYNILYNGQAYELQKSSFQGYQAKYPSNLFEDGGLSPQELVWITVDQVDAQPINWNIKMVRFFIRYTISVVKNIVPHQARFVSHSRIKSHFLENFGSSF